MFLNTLSVEEGHVVRSSCRREPMPSFSSNGNRLDEKRDKIRAKKFDACICGTHIFKREREDERNGETTR